MSITTPVIIVFKEYMDAGYMPSFINGGNMTFKSLQATPSTNFNVLTTYNILEIGQGYISYNNEPVYADGWQGCSILRAIYVTDWGDFDSDALLDWIENGDPQYAPEIWPVNIEEMRVKFNNSIEPRKVYGYIGFSSNGHTFDYIDCYTNDGYNWKVRYDLGDDYRVIPAAGYDTFNWNLSGYRVVSFKEWESSATDTTKVPFTLWIAANSSRISSLPSYKLGWKPKPIMQSYQVTITASEAWANSSHGVITFYDGQDNTGDVLLTQNPADKSAYPLTLSVSSGYLYINIYAPDQFGVSITSNDYSTSSNAFIIDKDGTINIQVVDFYD